jgi:hypothetical protein
MQVSVQDFLFRNCHRDISRVCQVNCQCIIHLSSSLRNVIYTHTHAIVRVLVGRDNNNAFIPVNVVILSILCKKSLKIPKRQSEIIYRIRPHDTMAKRKSTKGQTTINRKGKQFLLHYWHPFVLI